MHPLRLVKSAVKRLTTKPLDGLPNCPDIFYSYRKLTNHPALKRKQGGWEYKGKFYPDYLTVGGAGQAIFREALKYCQGSGIDVGAGLWPLPGAIPVDIWRGPGASKTLEDFADGSQDFVFSSHCLEHNADWKNVLAKWAGKVKPQGVLFLYLPHPECGIWEPGSPFVGDDHKWSPNPEVIKSSLRDLGFALAACDDGPDAMYSFWVCAKKER
jgi:SAM-dependent methyltransferase